MAEWTNLPFDLSSWHSRHLAASTSDPAERDEPRRWRAEAAAPPTQKKSGHEYQRRGRLGLRQSCGTKCDGGAVSHGLQRVHLHEDHRITKKLSRDATRAQLTAQDRVERHVRPGASASRNHCQPRKWAFCHSFVVKFPKQEVASILKIALGTPSQGWVSPVTTRL